MSQELIAKHRLNPAVAFSQISLPLAGLFIVPTILLGLASAPIYLAVIGQGPEGFDLGSVLVSTVFSALLFAAVLTLLRFAFFKTQLDDVVDNLYSGNVPNSIEDQMSDLSANRLFFMLTKESGSIKLGTFTVSREYKELMQKASEDDKLLDPIGAGKSQKADYLIDTVMNYSWRGIEFVQTARPNPMGTWDAALKSAIDVHDIKQPVLTQQNIAKQVSKGTNSVRSLLERGRDKVNENPEAVDKALRAGLITSGALLIASLLDDYWNER